jgi:hypothetical protein
MTGRRIQPNPDRRGFLKLFGAGALICPIIGETPNLEATAKLIEEPQVVLAQPVPAHSSGAAVRQFSGIHDITVMIDGQCFTAKSFFVDIKSEIGTLNNGYGSEFVARAPRVKWTLTGECVADEAGQLFQMYSS